MTLGLRVLLGALVIFASMVAYLWSSGPRLGRDSLGARDYVPAYSWRITDYKCTNWNGGIVSECTVSYKSPDTPRDAHSFTDWRFGRAPREGVMLMQRRNNAAAVTTDVSLQTIGNRLLLGIMLLGMGLATLIGLAVKAKKSLDGPEPDWTERATRNLR